ncbi:sensor histidine kinase [Streptomyces sp. WMMC905]|uniref:sensor histidine kinase n=1 Tax=Streptomyces sp. WMMC905 TaxID=3404123 RepID=UPI003B923009
MRLRVPLPRSLAGQLFAVQAVLIAVLVAGHALFDHLDDLRQAEEAAGRQARAVALALAHSPSVRAAIDSDDPSEALQPYALAVSEDTDVDFVTIMSPEGIRWTHPDPAQIGRRFRGHIGPARNGRTFTETYAGTLGPSVRVVTPVEHGDRIVGLVSAGIRVEAISARVRERLATLVVAAGATLLLGAAGTYLVNARLRRHTRGMDAGALARMHDYHQAALHAVREGLLMLDGRHRVALINDGGRELLGVPADRDVIGTPVAELGLTEGMEEALSASEPRVDEVRLTALRVLVVNTSPIAGDPVRGTVVTLRDVTELRSLMGELDSERGLSEALRAQAHEAANRLHTVVSLIELGRAEEAADFATAELELAQHLTDRVVSSVSEPVLAALLLGKTAQANERGVDLALSTDSRLDDGVLPPGLPARDLVTILGNLVDNAVDAASHHASAGVRPTGRAAVTVTVRATGTRLVLRVVDTGPGVDPADADLVFEPGFTTKPAGLGGRGLGLPLARQAVLRHGGSLTVARSPEGGAAFEARLPLSGRGAGPTPPSPEGTRVPRVPRPGDRWGRSGGTGGDVIREAPRRPGGGGCR